MPRLSRLVFYVIICFVLSSTISSQQGVLPSSENVDRARVVPPKNGKADSQKSLGKRDATIHEADIAGHNDGVSFIDTHLVGASVPSSSGDIESGTFPTPVRDGDLPNHQTMMSISNQGLPDAKSPNENSAHDNDGLIRGLMNWILGMIQTDFNFLISCGTVMSSLLTQIIPLHTIMIIRWNRSTGNLKTLNFVTVAFANFLWSLYGIVSSNTVIILSSLPGFLLSCCYIVVFHKHCEDSHQMHILRTFYKVAVVSCLVLMLIYLGVDRESYLKFIGLFGGSIQGFSYITPLLSIKEIVQNRSTSAMPTEISLANFVGSFFTLCYGFIIWDYIVIAPNFVGMVSGMIQIILLVLITNNDKIIVKEVDILEKQHFKPVLKADLEM